MQPQLSDIHTTDESLEFRLSNIPVSIANALRRTILSDMERIVLNPQQIEVNTSGHFHNEIMKHRIQSVPFIPMHKGSRMTNEEMVDFVQEHRIEIDVQNTGAEKSYVTTGDFKIWSKTKQEYLADSEVREKFPPYRNDYYIDLMRLYPAKGPTIPGEQFKAKIDLAINTAKNDGCFSVVSKCSYQNTPDHVAIEKVWAEKERISKEANVSIEVLEYNKRDFYLLDAERHYVENSFDFIVETNGIYENEDIVRRACGVLIQRFTHLKSLADSDDLTLRENPNMDHAYDVVLEDGDYTIGYLLDYVLYSLYVEGEKKLTFCGFMKEHPHKKQSVLRMAFEESQDMVLAKSFIQNACEKIIQVFESIELYFKKRGPK